MARDVFAENGIDPNEVRSGSKASAASPQRASKASNDPFEAYGINPEDIKAQSLMPAHPIASALGGVATAGQDVHNLLTPKSMNTHFDFTNMAGKPTRGDIIESEISKYIPGLATPGVGEGLLAKLGLKGASKIGSEMASQAAYGAAVNPENRLEGAAAGAGGTALGGAIAKGVNALRPSQLLRGKLSSPELAENMIQNNNLNTGLGDIIGSPGLKRTYENVLPHVPFSGASDVMQGTAHQLTKQGNDILDYMQSGLPSGDQGKIVQNALKEASDEARTTKNALYEESNKIADKTNLKVDRTHFKAAAQDALDSINASSELKAEFPKDLHADLERYAKDAENMNPEERSLRLSNIFKGKLSDKANNFYTNGNMYEYGLMKNLKNALKKDIDESIQTKGAPELRQAHQAAENYYKNEFAPFEDPNITKFTREGGDPDLLLSHFIRKSANDRGELLSKLTSKMPPESENLVANAYLASAKNDPQKLVKLFNNLGDKQKKALFPDRILRNNLETFSDVMGKNGAAFKTLENPPTGQKSLDIMTKLGQALVGFQFGGVPGVLASYLGGAALGRAGTHLLTNPQVRNKLVTKMIQNKPWEAHPAALRALGAAINSSKGKQ